MDSVLLFTAAVLIIVSIKNGQPGIAMLIGGFLAFGLKSLTWIALTLAVVGGLIAFEKVLEDLYLPAAFAAVIGLTLLYHQAEGKNQQQEQYPPGYGPEYGMEEELH